VGVDVGHELWAVVTVWGVDVGAVGRSSDSSDSNEYEDDFDTYVLKRNCVMTIHEPSAPSTVAHRGLTPLLPQ
jgi:hypothetical protein